MRLPLLFFSLLAGLHLCEASNDCLCVQSFDGKYLRAWQGPESHHHDYWHVDLAPHCLESEHWIVENRGDKVALKSDSGLFLRSRPQDIAYLDKSTEDSGVWSATQHEDGSWSFQDSNGRWLSAHNAHGIVGTMANVTAREKFRLIQLLPTPIEAAKDSESTASVSTEKVTPTETPCNSRPTSEKPSPAKSCPALRYLTQADVPAAFANYTIDTTQKAVFEDGIHRLKCAPASNFAYTSVRKEAGFRVTDWWITCAAVAGSEWRTNNVNGNGHGNYPMLDVAVGCVRPAKSCPALRYLTQADVPAAFAANYTIDAMQKAVFEGGIHQLKCAPGTKFAHISVRKDVGFLVSDWWITCSSVADSEWRTNNVDGNGLGNYPMLDIPVGCVRLTGN